LEKKEKGKKGGFVKKKKEIGTEKKYQKEKRGKRYLVLY